MNIRTTGIKTRKISFVLIFCLQAVIAFADDGSARRFAGLDRDAMTTKYFLLSTTEVQTDLKLNDSQIQLLKDAMLTSTTNIPGIIELRNSREKLIETAHSEKERAEIRGARNEKVRFLIYQNWKVNLQNALSSGQSNRLDEIFLQMEGPGEILNDTNLITELHLTKGQADQMKNVTNSYHEFLFLMRGRFLSLQIQPIRKRDSGDVDSELDCLGRVIKEVEKDQDEGLLAVLNNDQRRAWDNLCGVPLSIDWKADYFSDVPFQQCEVNAP